jgi:hypothetical protein
MFVTTPRSRPEVQAGQVAAVLVFALLAAALADQAIGRWLGFSSGLGDGAGTYRRTGPETGPQVFCAGSSLLQFGLSWREVSATLRQGIENWGVGGSSPEIWELSQPRARNSNLMIVGVSVYDLNEARVSDARATLVPFVQTVRDLWESGASWPFSRRLFSQYLLAYLRSVFPTAGHSDRVQVRLRSKAQKALGLRESAEDRDNALLLPSKPVLEFGESRATVTDWSPARLLRRLSLIRAESGGLHQFNGPKRLAMHRMLIRARGQGQVIVVVMPVTRPYADEFLTSDVTTRFEHVLDEVRRLVPEALVIRLDLVPGIASPDNFSDLVHLNSVGRRLATAALLRELRTRRDGAAPSQVSR